MPSLTVKQQQTQSIFGTGKPTKIEIRAFNHIVIDGIELDMRKLPSGKAGSVSQGSRQSGSVWTCDLNVNGRQDAVFTVTDYIARSMNPVAPTDTVIDLAALPNYFRWPDGENQAPQTITYQSPGNYDPVAMYRTDQEKAIAAIKAWRAQKKAWMLEAAGYEDIAGGKTDSLVDKVGQWLKSGDSSIQNVFQDPNVAPLDVASIATFAAQGALDVTSVLQFMQSVYLGTAPPTTAKLWVRKVNPARLNLSAIEEYSSQNILNHNTLDESWLVVNQPGKVVLDDTTPTQGQAINATLTDPDGGIGNITWTWERQFEPGQPWNVIAGANAASYTPGSSDAGHDVRAIARYTDNANGDLNNKNVATSAATSDVI